MRVSRKTYDKSGLSKLDRFRQYYSTHPEQFIEEYCKIRVKKPGNPIVPLKLKAGQRQAIAAIQKQIDEDKPIRLVILKSRQVGISTAIAAYVFAQCYTQNNMEAMVMAHEKDVTTNLFRTYRRFLEQLPTELQIPLDRSNKEELIWKPTDTLIKVATAGTKHSTRSRTIQWFHGSEAAFYKDLKTTKDAMEGSVPLLPRCGIIFETTAFGTGTDFHELWEDAGTDESPYEQVFLKWWEDEEEQLPPFASERDQDAYLEGIFAKRPRLKDRMEHYKLTPRQIGHYYQLLVGKFSGDEIRMATEYPCDPEEAFVATGQPVFPTYLTQDYKLKTKDGTLYDPTIPFTSFQSLKEAPHLRRNEDIYLELWMEPRKDRQYVISVDPAGGLATSDPTSAFIFDIFTQNIVGELHGRIDPKRAADILIPLAQMYNGAMIAPENDGLGSALLSHIKDRYYNIYQWRRLDGFGWKTTNILGWETTEQSRLEMITTARRLYAERVADAGDFIPSKMLIGELGTFVHSNLLNNKAVAERNCYDDRVMAWCIGVAVCLQELQCRPDLAAIVETMKQITGVSDVPPATAPSEIIQMVRNPNWTGQVIRDSYEGPFFMEEGDDDEED